MVLRMCVRMPSHNVGQDCVNVEMITMTSLEFAVSILLST